MNGTLQKQIGSEFVWLPKLGFGYYPAFDCKTEYFNEYQNLEGSGVCDEINRIRVDMVQQFIGNAMLLDFGIGAGTFIQSRGPGITKGYDRDGAGVEWLMKNGCWLDPYGQQQISHISFWDAFEHLEHPEVLLRKVTGFVFMSLPIFVDCDHVLQSKHFKPNEHFWYFTAWGLEAWMKQHGFSCRFADNPETRAGREDVGSFVFERTGDA